MINTNGEVVLPVIVYNWLNWYKVEGLSLRECLKEAGLEVQDWLKADSNEMLFALAWLVNKYTCEETPKKYHVVLEDMGNGFTEDEKDLYLLEYEGGGMYEFVTLKKINKEFFLGRIEFTEEEVSGVIKDMGFARFAKEIK